MRSGSIHGKGEEFRLRSRKPRELNAHMSVTVKLGEITDVVKMKLMKLMKLSLHTGREGVERSRND